MTSTEVLIAEHGAIDVLLGCLARIATQAAQSGQLDTAGAAHAIELMTHFVEARHHSKEERFLFESLVGKGWPRDEGAIAVMLADHAEGRALMRRMLIACDATTRGLANEAVDFAHAAEACVNLLRGHMRRENQYFFPQADRSLTVEDHAALVAAFVQVDAQQDCDASACLVELARTLASRLGVSAEALAAVRCSCRTSESSPGDRPLR
jgi:hemerythrin-like domain-containing protein